MAYIIKRYKCRLVSDGHVKVKYDPAVRVDGQNAALDIIHKETDDLPGEAMIVVYLNGRNMVLGHEVVARGGAHGLAVTARDILRGAIVMNASAIILGHNHPSGDPTPSREDYDMTRALERAADAVGIPLLDHLIVARGVSEYNSMLALGAIKSKI